MHLRGCRCACGDALQLDWHKNTLGKSLVQLGAEADSKRCWARLVASLQQHIATKGGLALPDDAAGPGAAAQHSEAAGAVDSHSASSKVAATGNLFGGAEGSLTSVLVTLLVLLVVLLLVLVASVRSGTAQIAGELHQLTAALRAVSGQCAAPSPGLVGYMTR
jgi:hypothetical protein